jgi:heptosyltransferase-1
MQQSSLSPSETQPPSRILIVRLSAHGDIMHTLPLLSAIKRANPKAHVGWLVETAAAPLLEGHPLIDCLHVAHRKRWMQAARNPQNWPTAISEVRVFLQELRQQDYSISIDVQGLFKSAVWPFLAGISHRYGYKGTRESADIFYTHKLPPMNIRDPLTPAVERYLDFARALGCPVTAPEFVLPPVSEERQSKMDALLSGLPTDRPRVVLAPFTRWDSKHWVPRHWVQLMAKLLARNLQPVLIGAPEDRPAAEDMLAEIPTIPEMPSVLNLVGQTDWPDLYALFNRARLLIGPDSAPLHIANAVGIDVIGLYGPTAPGRTGPLGDRQMAITTQLPCQPCFERHCPLKTHDCMRQLDPVQVMAAVERMPIDDPAVRP